MSDQLLYKFKLSSNGQRFVVQLPKKQQFRPDEVFLQCVIQHIPDLETAWREYRLIAPTNGRYFQIAERATFDKLVEKLRDDPDSLPIARMAIVDVVSERSDVQMQSAREEKRKAAKRGAKTVRDEVKNVLREVAPAVGTLAFRSQRGQDAFRMAMQTEPGSVVSGERREKRKLPHGLTMPTYDSARKQRVETKAELAARTDVVYIAKDDAGNFVELDVCPENDADLVGVCFDLLAQFETALDLDERSGQLQPAPVLAPGSDPPPLHLQIVVGSDGVDNVLGCLARVLDRRKLLFKRGRSRLLRVLLAWTPQSAIRKLAFMRNAQLSKLVNARCVEQRCVAIVELCFVCSD